MFKTREYNRQSIKKYVQEENKRNINKIVAIILLALLIVQYFYVMGMIHQVTGDQYSIIYNAPNDHQIYGFGNVYLYDQEIISAYWLNTNIENNNPIIYSDAHGDLILTMRTNLSAITIDKLNHNNPQSGYIYLTHTTTIFEIHPEDYEVNSLFNKKSLIYNNNISKIYK